MIRLSILIVFLFGSAHAAKPLIELRNCTLIPTDWADGDSFLVRTAEGEEHTVRLYGADCIESHVGDDSDARRLRAQRRYFGISEFGGGPETSIVAAKEYGKKANERRVEILNKPFTIHSAFSDARGDGKHKRIYAFVSTPDGQDLAAQLIKEGLARAYGVSRETPKGRPADDYREELNDLELQAAKLGVGVWKLTDWKKLPDERQLERNEDAELALAINGNVALEPASIDLNTAARDELMALPGVGESTANAIIEKRPFSNHDELLEVHNIGPKTLGKIRPFLKISE